MRGGGGKQFPNYVQPVMKYSFCCWSSSARKRREEQCLQCGGSKGPSYREQWLEREGSSVGGAFPCGERLCSFISTA